MKRISQRDITFEAGSTYCVMAVTTAYDSNNSSHTIGARKDGNNERSHEINHENIHTKKKKKQTIAQQSRSRVSHTRE